MKAPGYWTLSTNHDGRVAEAFRVDNLGIDLAGSGAAGAKPPVWRIYTVKPGDIRREVDALPATLSLLEAIARADEAWPPPSWVRVERLA